jgi:signal transduction histidine kinase
MWTPFPSAAQQPALDLPGLSRFQRGSGVVAAGIAGLSAFIVDLWRSWSLARQFATCASIVLIPAMTVTGLWVGSRIEEGVTQRAGISALLYMENFVEPLVQDLAVGPELSPARVSQLGSLLRDTTLGQRVLTFKIWRNDGVIMAGSRPELVGQKFPLSAGLTGAFRGVPKVEFDHLNDAENLFEQKLGIPILEIYVPLRAPGSDRIIAVGEFYEKATELKTELNRARLLSWLVVGGVTLSMLSALFAIVHRGSRTIERQRAALEQRVGELTDLLAENQHLRERARQASSRASESNEGFLRRLGADLHDGPAQLISAVLLRIDSYADSYEKPRKPVDTIYIRNVLTDALRDIRNLARGLAVPEIDAIPLEDALRHAVDQHRQVSATRVTVTMEPLVDVPQSVKLCAYRFVQEGLTNAFKHAGGAGQTVDARVCNGDVVITVSDSGNGKTLQQSFSENTRGFGLRALTDRIESIGGTLQINLSQSDGTQLIAKLPVFRNDETGAHHVDHSK